MIRFVDYRLAPGEPAVLAPYFRCEVCGALIDADRPGIYAYGTRPPAGTTSRLFDESTTITVHKGECDRRARAVGLGASWRDLGNLLDQLVKNYRDPISEDAAVLRWLGDGTPARGTPSESSGIPES